MSCFFCHQIKKIQKHDIIIIITAKICGHLTQWKHYIICMGGHLYQCTQHVGAVASHVHASANSWKIILLCEWHALTLRHKIQSLLSGYLFGVNLISIMNCWAVLWYLANPETCIISQSSPITGVTCLNRWRPWQWFNAVLVRWNSYLTEFNKLPLVIGLVLHLLWLASDRIQKTVYIHIIDLANRDT